MAKEQMEMEFKEYVAKPKESRARILTDAEIVNCYNGTRIGQKGDYVVVDHEDRVMIMKASKFENTFREKKR